MTDVQEKLQCEKCGRTVLAKEFYTKRDGEKTSMCKKCLTMHADCFQPDTFLWILELIDVPYVPEAWNGLRDKEYAKKGIKLSSMSVLGKYLAKMRLNQFKGCGWADSERLQELYGGKKKRSIEAQLEYEAELKRQLANGEISEAQYKTFMDADAQYREEISKPTPPPDTIGQNNLYNENNFISEQELFNVMDELTQEDKIYLATKWGRLYRADEWLALEQHYKEMEQGFDIQDPDTINTLKVLSKTYLKMNQAIDTGDIDTYQKLTRVYESLRKSAKFTAAQRKEEKEEFVDCVGLIVSYCEKTGGAIPKYEIETDNDIIDTVIKDLKQYNKSLIYEDTALARQIEDYLKKREVLDQQKRDKELNKKLGIKEEDIQLTDQDHIDYMEYEKELIDADSALYEEEE